MINTAWLNLISGIKDGWKWYQSLHEDAYKFVDFYCLKSMKR